MDVAAVAVVGQALSDPTRLQVLRLANGRLGIGEIARQLGVSSATITHHVRVLQQGGVIIVDQRGRRRIPRRIDDGLRVLARELS